MGRHDSPFVVPVADLLAHPGTRRTVQLSGLLAAGTDLARTLDGEPLVADLTCESLVDGVLVTGSATVAVHVTCNRCLTEWDEIETVELTQLFTAQPDEDGYRIDHDAVDLEGPLRDEVTLALPLAPLCGEDCRGLCPTCGADLNADPCGGHPESGDSPFAVLRELLPGDG
jgi:uncharacterized protein